MIQCKDCKWWNRLATAHELRECLLIGGYPGSETSPYAQKVVLHDVGWVDTAPDFGCIAGELRMESEVNQ
jgi:hypothetical protein